MSITLDSAFCVAALDEAIARYGRPEIVNTDQGAQFTSAAFTGLLLDHGIRISMDGRGCWRDNIFVERLWRSLTYEEVYLHGYESVSAATAGIAPLLHPLQHPTAPLKSHRPHARRRLLLLAAARCGRLTRLPIPLSNPVNLYREAEPLQRL